MDDKVSCHLCKMPIVKSAAKSAEGKDYVWYLCNECYQHWSAEQKSQNTDKRKT